MKKKYFCKDCDVEVRDSRIKLCRNCYNNSRKSKKIHCTVCEKELANPKATLCQSCFGISRRGKNNTNYKGGKPKCIDCGQYLTDYRATRCHSCENKQRIKIENNYCIDCDCDISKYHNSIRCHSCNMIYQWKNKTRNLSGNKNPSWIDGRTKLQNSIRHSSYYKNWRNKIFKRDNFNCQECSQHGGNLEAHHTKPFREILQEFLNFYNQFSLLEEKNILLRLVLTWEDFWNINYGITYCVNCHVKHDKHRKKLLVKE